MYEGNQGEIDFGSLVRGLRVDCRNVTFSSVGRLLKCDNSDENQQLAISSRKTFLLNNLVITKRHPTHFEWVKSCKNYFPVTLFCTFYCHNFVCAKCNKAMVIVKNCNKFFSVFKLFVCIGLFQKKSTPPRRKTRFFDPPPLPPGFPKLLEPPSAQDFQVQRPPHPSGFS